MTKAELAKRLTELFPDFASELEDDVVEAYHRIVQLAAPLITTYLEDDPSKIRAFCDLGN
jgi:hypothetical protein